MTTPGTLLGWVAAAGAAAVALGLVRELRRRMEAVARACHELRGPLCAARLGLALGYRDGELDEARLHAIDVELGRAALALSDLAPTRISRRRRRRRAPAAKMGRVERIELAELAACSVEAWRATARAAGVSLRAASPRDPRLVSAWGDRLRLAQALGNLIANAIEHGRGHIEVTVAARREAACVEVSDTGPGLPAPVAQLCRGPRNGAGPRGRGLAIASEIAVAHGGRLAAAPSERGARLVLELPLAPDSVPD